MQKLLTRASDIVTMRQEYVPEFQSVLAKGQLLQKNIRECDEQIRSLSFEDCLAFIPESNRPRIIKFPEGELADSVLLQLNPLSSFAVWIYPTKETKTQHWFRFNLNGFPSRAFYHVCWCDSCIPKERKKTVGNQFVMLCTEHGIKNVLVRLKEREYDWIHGDNKKIHVFDDSLHNRYFAFKGEDPALVIQSTSLAFDEREGKEMLGQHIWLTVPGSSGVKIETIPEPSIFVN